LEDPPYKGASFGDWLHFIAETHFISFAFFGPTEDLDRALQDFCDGDFAKGYTRLEFPSQLIFTKVEPGVILPRFQALRTPQGVAQEICLGGLLTQVCAESGIHLVSHLDTDLLSQILYLRETILNLEDLLHYLREEGLLFQMILNRDQLWIK